MDLVLPPADALRILISAATCMPPQDIENGTAIGITTKALGAWAADGGKVLLLFGIEGDGQIPIELEPGQVAGLAERLTAIAENEPPPKLN